MNRRQQRQQLPSAPMSTTSYRAPAAPIDYTAPSTGFETHVRPETPPRNPERVSDIEKPDIPAPTPRPAQLSPLRSMTSTKVLENWRQFEDPVLLQLQTSAVKNANSSQNAFDKMTEDGYLCGSRIDASPRQQLNTLKRMLLIQVAEAYSDVRLYQERLGDYYKNLEIQQTTLREAQRRKQEGKAGRLDILQVESAMGVTKSKMSPVRDQLRTALKRLTILTGEKMDPAMVRSIAAQSQLRLPKLERTLPASVLSNRCDVDDAQQAAIAAGAKSGVYEATLVPILSLEGELIAKDQAPPAEGDPQIDFGFQVDSAPSWSFGDEAKIDNAGGNRELEQRLQDYQDVVFTAANEVEELLTQYHVTLREIEALQQATESASEANRLAMQQFTVDRTDGENVIASQARRMLSGQALAKARARLARIGIELFVASGTEHNNKVPSAAYQSEGYRR